MMILAIALVSSGVAFVAGWLLGKVYFGSTAVGVSEDKHHSLLKAQRTRYRKRVMAINNLVERHEETRDEIKNRLADLQDGLEKRTRALQITKKELEKERDNAATARNELGLLQIERDELVARVLRLESEKAATTPADVRPASESHVAELKATLGHMREILATREHQIKQFAVQLKNSRQQAQESDLKLSDIKRRMQPLTRQLRIQKQLIQKANANQARAIKEDEPGDDLKAIRGIGPALERRLQARGIRRFNQLAEMTDSQLANIAADLSIARTLPLRDEWIEQARALQRRQNN